MLLLLVRLIQLFISRDCEYEADAHAAAIVGPRPMMTALQKLDDYDDTDEQASQSQEEAPNEDEERISTTTTIRPLGAITGIKKHVLSLVQYGWKVCCLGVELPSSHPATEKRIKSLQAIEEEMRRQTPNNLTHDSQNPIEVITASQSKQDTCTNFFMNTLRFWFLPSE
jgi:Zn-dependent protease with chaperone function